MGFYEGDVAYTLDELMEKYQRQWIAATVVERDNLTGQPVKVKMLAREINSSGVRQAAWDTGSRDFCTIYTGPIPEIEHVGMF
jgi:hypothetical protein